jgi:hypothetical protein
MRRDSGPTLVRYAERKSQMRIYHFSWYFGEYPKVMNSESVRAFNEDQARTILVDRIKKFYPHYTIEDLELISVT